MPRKDPRPIKGGGEMDSPVEVTIILLAKLLSSLLDEPKKFAIRICGSESSIVEKVTTI